MLTVSAENDVKSNLTVLQAFQTCHKKERKNIEEEPKYVSQ